MVHSLEISFSKTRAMFGDAFAAGIWSSLGSTLGKLSGSSNIIGDSYYAAGPLLVAMVVVNTWGCRLYLRSLDAAANSVAPTVVSTASNYVLSGLIGTALFGESVGWRWWAGVALVTAGLALLATPDKQRKQ